MIEHLSNRLATKLKEINPEETASVEVMSFALQGILHNTLTFMTALIGGMMLGQFWETFLAVIFFMALRLISGGFHFKSALACFIVSASVFIVIPMFEPNNNVLLLINIISFLLVAIYAPSNIKEHIRYPEKYYPIFKILSLAIVSINFFFLASIVTVAFFVQACSLVTFKKEVS